MLSQITIGNIAAVVTLLGGIIWLVKWYRATKRKLKQQRQDADEQLDQALKQFESAGRTVGGRTDVGFLVLLNLETLNDYLHHLRYTLLMLFVAGSATGISSFVAWIAQNDGKLTFTITNPDEFHYTYHWVLQIGFMALWVSWIVFHMMYRKHDRFVSNYRKRVRVLWSQAVYKRSTKKKN